MPAGNSRHGGARLQNLIENPEPGLYRPARRRSTTSMISEPMCLTVLTHVRKDTKRHAANCFGNPWRPQSWADAYIRPVAAAATAAMARVRRRS